MDNNPDKPSLSSVKLDGFAPPAGSGAGSSFMAAGLAAASASVSAGATLASSSAASSVVVGGGAGAGATTASIAAAPPAKSTGSLDAASSAAKTKRGNKKKAPGKKGGTSASASAAFDANNDDDAEEIVLRPLSDVGSDFAPLSLPQIQLRLKSLLDKLPADLPEVPPAYDPVNNDADVVANQHAPIKSFASTLQIAIEEYNLLLSLVSCATYKWGVDRSGASQQNLSVMSAELQQCQDVISNVVSARLSNVLCPAVDVVIGEVEIVRDGARGDDGKAENVEAPAKKRKLNEDKLSTLSSGANGERRVNHFTRPLVDPSYVHLCHCILARNAPLIRHTVATSVYTAQRVIGDYSKAMKKDSSHDSGKGGYY